MRSVVIGIPTYNRADKCVATVNQILEAVADLAYVSVMVVDNSDQTNPVLSQLNTDSAVADRFDYIKNEKNLGLDGSLLKLCSLVKARNAHLWFLCDDDTLFSEGVKAFAEAIGTMSSPVKLCEFGFMETGPSALLGTWREAREVDYFRASFLPTLCIDTQYYDEGELSDLIGCNYIHLAIINQTISSLSDAKVFQGFVGSQTVNNRLGFSLKDTFIEGFISALSHQRKMPITRIKQVTYFRLKGYLGHLFKTYLSNRQSTHSVRDLVGTASAIIRQFGVVRFLLLAPRLSALLMLSLFR
jgi:glycosyltransferase involved in cell wall biosynthesis